MEGNMSNALHTERLILRPPGRQDLNQFVPLIGDYEVAKYLSRVPHPYTEQNGRDFLLMAARGWARDEDHIFAIGLKNARACIGMCGVHPSRGWEIGYWLGRPYWGRGFTTEAGQVLIQYAFDQGANRLAARWFHDNPASGRVLEKLGFVHTGEDSTPCLARGMLVNAHVMALNRKAHTARKIAA
jgi:RimJ/RimL family protein N-acetyltransferase